MKTIIKIFGSLIVCGKMYTDAREVAFELIAGRGFRAEVGLIFKLQIDLVVGKVSPNLSKG